MKTTTSGRHPTTAEWLAGRDGVIIVCHFANMMWQQSWARPGQASAMRGKWAGPTIDTVNLARSTSATHLFIKINNDAQTIRVLVDGDDALVVVHARDCGYHRSMRRGMQVVLRGLKEQRKAALAAACRDVARAGGDLEEGMCIVTEVA